MSINEYFIITAIFLSIAVIVFLVIIPCILIVFDHISARRRRSRLRKQRWASLNQETDEFFKVIREMFDAAR